MSGSKTNGDLFIQQHMCGQPSKNINGPFDLEDQQVHLQYHAIKLTLHVCDSSLGIKVLAYVSNLAYMPRNAV